MKNHKEMFEALLAGETLVNENGYNLILNAKGRLEFPNSVGGLLTNNAKYVLDVLNWEIKPKTININGFEVPEPLTIEDLVEGKVYFVVSFTGPQGFYTSLSWYAHNEYCRDFVTNGLLHSTKEAAILHAKALLSFTRKDND